MFKIKTTYPLWQYPIIFLFLFHFLIKIKFRIRTLIDWRRDIGVISKNHKITLSDIISFGHWLAGETLNDWWHSKPLNWNLTAFLFDPALNFSTGFPSLCSSSYPQFLGDEIISSLPSAVFNGLSAWY